MRIGHISKAINRVGDHTNQRSQIAFDPLMAEPNVLRDRVFRALSLIPEDERSRVRDNILAVLNKAGVNLGQCLLLLGIPARTPDELTAPEIAAVIRYVRINDRRAMTVLGPALSELLTANVEPTRGLKASSRAAQR